MKFRLQLPKLPTRKQQQTRLLAYDTGTVESWNELRVIGSEYVQKRQTGKTSEEQEQDQDEGRSLVEAHDWDFYIAQFNEQYRQQLIDAGDKDKEGDRDSISTLVETQSQLIRSRQQRLAVFRRLFIVSCLLLWVFFLIAQANWFYMYTIWPIGFLSLTDNSIQAQYFTYKWKWEVFIINCHTWLVGCLGLLCAFCFRENSMLLRQFILRIPYVLLIPTVLVFLAVRFTGTFSTQKLSLVMDTAMSRFYDNNQGQVQATSIRNWDQLQKLLQCCGIQQANDWQSVDSDLTDDKSYIPASCCPPTFVRRAWTRERRSKDDCYYKIDPLKYEWTYPDGCLNLAQEFYVKMGAYVVGIMVLKFCGLCLCLCFGKQYYTLLNFGSGKVILGTVNTVILSSKTQNIRFKYSWKQWFTEILCLQCYKNCCKSNRKKSKGNKQTRIFEPSKKAAYTSNVDRVPSMMKMAANGNNTTSKTSITSEKGKLKVGFGELDAVAVPQPNLVSDSSISTVASTMNNNQTEIDMPNTTLIGVSNSSISTVVVDDTEEIV